MGDGDDDSGLAFHFCRGDLPPAVGAISSAAVGFQSSLILLSSLFLYKTRKSTVGLALLYTPLELAVIVMQAVILPIGETFFVWGDHIGVVSGGSLTTSAVTTWIVVNILIDLILMLACVLFFMQKIQNFRVVTASANPFRIAALVGIICDRAMNELIGIESLMATALILLSLFEMGFCYARHVEPSGCDFDTVSGTTSQHEVRDVAGVQTHADWYRAGYKTSIKDLVPDEAGTPPSTPKGAAMSLAARAAAAVDRLDFEEEEKSVGFDEALPVEEQKNLATTAMMMARAQINRMLANLDATVDPKKFVDELLALKATESKQAVASGSATASGNAAETNSSVRRRRTHRSREHSESDGTGTGSAMVMATLHRPTTAIVVTNSSGKKDDAEVSGY